MKRIDSGHKNCLIGKINGLSEQSRKIRKRMNKAEQTENEAQYYKLYMIKRSIRYDARHHALAYAYLKGMPYNVLEPKCHEAPCAEAILKVVMLHSYFHLSYYKESIAKIQDWLKGVK